MMIECSSNIFHVVQPSGYGRDYTWEEGQANEDYQQFLDERIREKFQRYFNFRGLKNYRGTKRRNLPDWHPDRAKEGYYEVSGRRYLEKIIAPAWMNLLAQQFAKRAEGSGVTVSLEATGVYSPKCYNYWTDSALFQIHIPAEDIEKMRRQVFVYPKVFETYLQEYCGSGPGFISSRPYRNLEKWEEFFGKQSTPWPEKPPYFGDWELALWCLLEFWLFAFDVNNPEQPPCLKTLERNLHAFGEIFDWKIDQYREDLHYKEYMRFIPENSKELACA